MALPDWTFLLLGILVVVAGGAFVFFLFWGKNKTHIRALEARLREKRKALQQLEDYPSLEADYQNQLAAMRQTLSREILDLQEALFAQTFSRKTDAEKTR